MIVRNLKDAEATPRRVATDNWESTRLLLKDDAMGFSFHITTVYAGTENRFWYKHHLESVYCISGTGSIEDLATGEVHRIEPGVVYALDRHDRHVLRADADADLVFACVFNPPVSGREVHDADGAYLPDGDPLPTDPSDDRAGEEHAA